MSSLSPQAKIIVRKISKRYSRIIFLVLGRSELEYLGPALCCMALGKELIFVNLSFLLCENGKHGDGQDNT